MKKAATLYLIGIIPLLCSCHLDAAVGCMSKSQSLGKYDNKSYHYIECNCPCTHTIARAYNLCVHCGHVRESRPQIIVHQDYKQQQSQEGNEQRVTTWNRFKQGVGTVSGRLFQRASGLISRIRKNHQDPQSRTAGNQSKSNRA